MDRDSFGSLGSLSGHDSLLLCGSHAVFGSIKSGGSLSGDASFVASGLLRGVDSFGMKGYLVDLDSLLPQGSLTVHGSFGSHGTLPSDDLVSGIAISGVCVAIQFH